MRAYERFLDYVTMDTASNPSNADECPSTRGQRELGRKLAKEMYHMGMEDVYYDDAYGYAYGFVPAMPEFAGAAPLGLIAHLDTSPDASGKHVLPVLQPDYDGGDVTLASGRVIPVETFIELKNLKGQTLITASGDTLLGADDKAGIAEILTACEALLQNKVPHGRVCVAFTPDEEIGSGAQHLDFERFGARYAYTVDGGPVQEIEYENFNAASAELTFHGVAVHPGAAKDIMVNAARLAMEFDAMLPAQSRPEHTTGREGFFHLTHIEGAVEQATSSYIIRDHDRELFEQKKQLMQDAAAAIAQRYGAGSVELELTDSYYNMAEVIRQHFHLVENAQAAIREAGLEPVSNPIRGGTDGGRLSFEGLPCPNLGTGGLYFHGPNECITTEAMDKAVEVILNVVKRYAKPRQV